MKRSNSVSPESSINRAIGTCALCERQVSDLSAHHLVPRSQGGAVVVDLCSTCHKTLHSFFTNRTLAKKLSTLEALRKNPKIKQYLLWVRKQPDRRIRVRASRKKE